MPFTVILEQQWISTHFSYSTGHGLPNENNTLFTSGGKCQNIEHVFYDINPKLMVSIIQLLLFLAKRFYPEYTSINARVVKLQYGKVMDEVS